MSKDLYDVQPQNIPLLDAVTANAASAAARCNTRAGFTVMGKVAGTGALTGTIKVYGTMFNEAVTGKAVLLATLTLDGTTTGADASFIETVWPYMFVDLTNISGTSATVSCNLSY